VAALRPFAECREFSRRNTKAPDRFWDRVSALLMTVVGWVAEWRFSGENARMPTGSRTTYRGSCHCGFVRFEFDALIDHARECDCSICRRRGALIFRIEQSALRISRPLVALAVYRWGTKSGADYFCPHCGILPFRRPSQPTEQELADGVEPFDGWAINLRCIDGLDLDTLPRVRIEGSKIAF
jgi:hypothetical protein